MANLFQVVTRKELMDSQERCPKCSVVRQDFMKIMEGVLACYHCGTLFVPKAVRYKELEGKREQIAKQEAEKESPVVEQQTEEKTAEEFKCEVCGQICASKLGLNSHMRKHDKAE
jgi:DNA-directed RNA polymerase subunit M/transcription elongation factor TFIIS